MPETKPDAATDDDEASDPNVVGDALSIDGLKLRGDITGLLDLAKAYRSGTASGGRDMKRCFDAYCAAAELGSADAEYAVALFWMSGGVPGAAQDLKEGSMRLRAAAEKGSLAAKVYLGNLYEQGIFYKADAEKADVWYRNAARSANVTSEPGSDEHARDLADLGCARYVLALSEGGALSDDDKTRLLQKARAHGYGLRMKDEVSGDRASMLDGALSSAAPAVGTKPASKEPTPQSTPENHASKKPKPVGPSQASLALGAFGYTMLFALAGLGAGYAAMLGARELVAHGKALPGLGTRADLVFPIVLGVVGILPTTLVYRFGTVVKALLVGAFLGGIGWVAWGTGQAAIHALRPVQTLAFGLAGFLAGLFVFGLLGGTKRQPARRPKG